MPSTAGTASAFTLDEVTGEKRSLSLVGRALPYRPMTFTGSQRVTKNWYPGNPVATAQVLGSEEEDTTAKGMWKNRFLGMVTDTGASVVNPEAQVLLTDEMGQLRHLTSCFEVTQAVDDFRRKGQLLKVQWGPEIRYGFLTKFSRAWDREQDVAWEMTFSWISIENPTDLQTVVSTAVNVSDWRSRLKQLLNDIKNARAGFLAEMSEYSALVDSYLSQLEDGIQNVFDTIDSLTDAVLSPITVAKRLMAVCTRLSMQAQETLDAIASRIPWGSVARMIGDHGTAVKQLPDIESLSMGRRVSADAQYRTLRRAVRQIQAEATDQAQQAGRQVNPDLVAVFVAREGTDLRDVSRRYYGTPNEWRQLARFNGVVGSLLARGQHVLVPRLRQLEEQRAEPPLKPVAGAAS